MTADGPERLARAGLSLHAQPDRATVRRLRADGAEATWAALGRDDDEPVRLLEASAAAGVRFVIPGDDEWPSGLGGLVAYTAGAPTRDDLESGRAVGVPFGLWVRGPLLPPSRSVAVVGARAATPYGQRVATDLGAGLAERGACVVSGAAYGIDAAAHRGALAVGGHTVAVLACGLDLAYPQGHEALISRIAETGSVVSEHPLGVRVRRQTFLRRNRLIAALTRGTVLVEAGLRSGARNTIAHAQRLELGRLVVPGPVTSAMSAGCHAWLRSDAEACLVGTATEVLDKIGDPDDLGPREQGPTDPRDGLGAAARDLVDLLPISRPWPLARVAASVGLGTTETLGVLGALASSGLVEEVDGGYRLTPLGRSPTRR